MLFFKTIIFLKSLFKALNKFLMQLTLYDLNIKPLIIFEVHTNRRQYGLNRITHFTQASFISTPAPKINQLYPAHDYYSPSHRCEDWRTWPSTINSDVQQSKYEEAGETTTDTITLALDKINYAEILVINCSKF